MFRSQMLAYLTFLSILLFGTFSPVCRAQHIPDVNCGVYCLKSALSTLRQPPEILARVDEIIGAPAAGGYSIRQLDTAAQQLGLQSTAVRTTPENLQFRHRPFVCIALLSDSHFVILANIENDAVTIVDPPAIRETSLPALLSQWDGTALILSTEPLETEDDLTARIQGQQLRKNLIHRGGLVLIVGTVLGTVRVLGRRWTSKAPETA